MTETVPMPFKTDSLNLRVSVLTRGGDTQLLARISIWLDVLKISVPSALGTSRASIFNEEQFGHNIWNIQGFYNKETWSGGAERCLVTDGWLCSGLWQAAMRLLFQTRLRRYLDRHYLLQIFLLQLLPYGSSRRSVPKPCDLLTEKKVWILF